MDRRYPDLSQDERTAILAEMEARDEAERAVIEAKRAAELQTEAAGLPYYGFSEIIQNLDRAEREFTRTQRGLPKRADREELESLIPDELAQKLKAIREVRIELENLETIYRAEQHKRNETL